MTPDRDDLWKAYPDGFLGRRGVLTLGGWQCIALIAQPERTDQTNRTRWAHPHTREFFDIYEQPGPDGGSLYERRRGYRCAMPVFWMAVDLGDLLPDLTDSVTRFVAEQRLVELRERSSSLSGRQATSILHTTMKLLGTQR